MTFSVIQSARMRAWRFVAIRVAAIALALAATTAGVRAQVTSFWIGTLLTATGNWTDSLLWLPPPQSGYNVTINNLFPLTTKVVLDVNATVNQLTLGTGATLSIANGQSLRLDANSTIDGLLLLNSTGTSTNVVVGAANVTFSGSGSISMSANAANSIGGGSAAGLLNQVAISGSGTIGDGQMNLANQGSITATNASVPLIIEPNTAGMTNTGTLRASSGATLTLKGKTINTSGTIIADAASHIDAFQNTIVGGTLASVGTGHFHAIDAVFSGVTISPGTTIEVSNGDFLTLASTIVNDGLISVLATGGSSEVRFEGAVTLAGTGNITMSDATSNRITSASGGSTVTIGPLQTLRGAGELGRNSLGITNQGTILADGINPLKLDNAGSSFTNHGVLKATGLGGIDIRDATTNLGTIDIGSGSLIGVGGAFTQSGDSSATKLAGGTFTSNGFALQSGSLAGTGTINGAVNASGSASVSPGGPGNIGTLAFTSTLTLGPTTGVFFDLGGTTPGTGHDVIKGTSIALDGALFLSFTNGFQATVTGSDSLTLINASTALNGTFAGLPNGSRLTTLDGFGSFQINYSATALTLSNFQPIPEPSTYVLLTVGAFCVLMAEQRRRRRRSN